MQRVWAFITGPYALRTAAPTTPPGIRQTYLCLYQLKIVTRVTGFSCESRAIAMMQPTKIYDLSQPLYSDSPEYPDVRSKPVNIKLIHKRTQHGVNKELVTLSTHSGTHCDAPYHFFNDGEKIDEMPLRDFVGPATIVDLREKLPASPITREDLLRLGGAIGIDEIVLLNTGWGRKRGPTSEFLTKWPYLSSDGAAHLLERGVRGVGIDALSIAGFGIAGSDNQAHEALLGAGKFIVEELYFPDQIMDGKKRLFCAVPVKLQGCGGAWARAMLWDFER